MYNILNPDSTCQYMYCCKILKPMALKYKIILDLQFKIYGPPFPQNDQILNQLGSKY